MKALFIFLVMIMMTPVVSYSADVYNESTSSNYIKQAETNYKKVVKVKNPWRDTKKIIKSAKKAHNKKDFKKSITLAKKALNEANMALEQYEKQKDNYRFLD